MTMLRLACLACVAAALALPAPALADTPGYTPVGPPATLSDIIFASDGTMYGTADGSGDRGGNPVAIWRSGDHGRTWSAVYRLPFGWKIDLLQVSPADPDTVYAFQASPRGEATGTVERIDIRANRGVPLWLGDWLGVDAEGTAYGFARVKKTLEPAIVRCKRRVDACDYVKAPPFQTPAYLSWAIVDPSSAGVLVSSNRTDSGTFFEISTDAGATWQQGAPAPASCCNIQFAGPQAHTLYVRDGTQLSVSHDSGLHHRRHAQRSRRCADRGLAPLRELRRGAHRSVLDQRRRGRDDARPEHAEWKLVAAPRPDRPRPAGELRQ